VNYKGTNKATNIKRIKENKAMPRKPKDNYDLVKSIMLYSDHGALSQAFVIEAISRYANECSNLNPDDYKDNTFINMKAWKSLACEIHYKIEDFYARKKA
jgi:hypothetical protein